MAATYVFSAEAKSLTTVKVVLGDAGVPAAAADSSAFEKANWTLIPDPLSSLPRYTPTVIKAESQDLDFAVLLTANEELTPGVVYTAIATGVTGIPVNGIHNVAAFDAYPITSTPSGRSFDLLSFMPRVNLAEDASGELRNFIACLQEPTNLLWDQVDRWIDILDCDLAPENFVDLMLEDLGNPFEFADPLSLIDKRKLCHIIVEIYKLKGTVPGIQAAVLFFVGLRSELLPYSGSGDKLGKSSTVSGHGRLSRAPGPGSGVASQTFKLGTGNAWEFFMKLGTVTDPDILLSDSGSDATSKHTDRAKKILLVMKPAHLILVGDYIRSGAEPTQRSAIKDNGGGSVDLIMRAIVDSDDHRFWESGSPGVTRYNAQASISTAGSPPTATLSPAGVLYWNGVGRNVSTENTGLLSNEITNAMTKPVVTAIPGARKISLSWPAVSGATSYRIYRGVASFASPCAADNSQAPVEVIDEAYEDKQESGDTRYYRVTPVQGSNAPGAFPNAFASEGFFSDIVSGTAL